MSEEDKNLGNLQEFGVEFQNKCITALVTDRQFLERISDMLTPDYFETSAQKWVIEKTMAYFIEFKELPSPMSLSIEIKAIDDQMKLLKTSIADLLGVVYDHVSAGDLKYVKAQFLEFCKKRTLASAILASVEDLKMRNYDSIKVRIDAAMKAGMERNLGHDYFRDIDKRMTLASRNCVKTGWPEIDQLMDGGLGKGELGFVVAPSGAGKTWVLARFGAEAIRQGKNVLHVTLELNEEYVGLRYDSYFTGIGFQKIRESRDMVDRTLATLSGSARHFVKYFPLRSISAMSIKLFIERLQTIERIKIDMLIVDYADLLRPVVAEKNINKYNEAGSVYEELRGVAGELQIPVWSASQSNRGGHTADVVTANDVADSYRKIMTGDFILSLSRKEDDKDAETGRFLIVKNRFGPDGLTYPCRFNASTGHITLYDKASSEGKELLAKMDIAKKDAEKNPHKAGKVWWDKLMNTPDKNPSGD